MSAHIKDGGQAMSNLSMRDWFAGNALAGQLAAEGPEYGHMDEYIHPETGAPVIGKNSCYAVKSGDGKTAGYTYDHSKPLTPILKRSYAQAYAEISYELADAMLIARERKGGA